MCRRQIAKRQKTSPIGQKVLYMALLRAYIAPIQDETTYVKDGKAMFDRAAIMRTAWEIYRTVRYECERRALAKGFIAPRFANALRGAWADAKSSIAKPRTADQIRARILEIECGADFLTSANRAEIESLRQDLAALPDEAEAVDAGTPNQIVAEIRAALVTRIRSMREGATGGLIRENWKELGALRDKRCSELSASI